MLHFAKAFTIQLVILVAVLFKQVAEANTTDKYSICKCMKGDSNIVLACVDKSKGEFSLEEKCHQSDGFVIQLASCNDKRPCLYRWHTNEWTNCTESCGQGYRTRQLECRKRDLQQTVVDVSKCEFLVKPSDKENCNEVDCSPKSVFLGWSQCSTGCGEGVQYKQADCLQTLANGTVVASSNCSIDDIPQITKPCYNEPCEFDNSNFLKAAPHGRRSRRGASLHAPVIKTGSANRWITKDSETVEASIGDKISAIKGTKIFIKCLFGGKPEPRAIWYFNGKRVDNKRHLPFSYSYLDYKTVLEIPVLRREFSGKYECRIENRYGVLKAASILRMIRPGDATIFSKRKSITYGPEAKTITITIGTNVTMYDNTELKIMCPVQAYPYRHRIRWTLSGVADTAGINSYGLYGTDLIIQKSKKENSGRYTCRGETLWGSDKESSFITVKEKTPPKISSSDRRLIGRLDVDPFLNATIGDRVLVEEGTRIELICPVMGEPEPNIVWERRGVPIRLPNLSMFIKEDGRILVIKDINADATDTYSCLATNMAGQDSSSTKITVLPPGSKEPNVEIKSGTVIVTGSEKSQSVIIGQKIKVFEGKSFALYCPVTGNPKPEITWKFNQRKVEDNKGGNFMVDKSGGGLLIFDINKKIEGTYSCVAKNALGESTGYSSLKILTSLHPSVIARSNNIKIGKENKTVSIVIGDRLKTSGGRKIMILCAVDGWPRPKVIWNKNKDAVLASARKIDVGTAGGEMLTIEHATEEDSGVYTCYAMNAAGVAMSSSILKILAAGSPVITSNIGSKKFLKEDKNIQVSIGTNVTSLLGNTLTITCPYEGTDDSQVIWTIDNQRIKFNRRIAKIADNVLRIENVKFYDSGLYTCKVWNSEGKDSESTLLTISGTHNSILRVSNRKSKIESFNSDEDLHVVVGHHITVTKGHNIHITCPVRGVARPNIKWFKDNVPISHQSLIYIEGEQLILSNVTKHDTGMYSCIATSKFGSSNSTTMLTVIEPSAPVIERTDRTIKGFDVSSTMKINVGDRLIAVKDMTVEIVCPIKDGVPKPKIYWRHNNAVIISNSVYAQVKENNDLLIPKLNPALQGLYTCVAENIKGKDEASTTILITLSRPPSIIRSNKKITQHASMKSLLKIDIGDKLKTTSGQDIMINCNADGIPKPNVIWSNKQGGIVENSRITMYQNGSLEIKQSRKEDSGSYICTVINDKGVDKYTSEVKILGNSSAMIVAKKPEQVTNIHTNKVDAKLTIGSNITTLDRKMLTLLCPSSGNPKPKISWYKEGMLVVSSKRISFGSDNELIIKDIQVDDAAVYTCVADNGRGRDKVSSVVNVAVPLERLITEPAEIEKTDIRSSYLSKKVELQIGMTGLVLSGKTVIIECPTQGSIKPKITWWIGDQQIQNDNIHTLQGDALVIRNQQAGDFQYTCKAESNLGTRDATTDLSIVDPVPPSIKSTRKSKLTTDEKVRIDIGGKVKVKLGSQLDIKCPSVGIPVPEFSWFRNNKQLTDADDVVIKGTGSIIRIPYVRMKDVGTYVCAASNGIGKKATESIIVEAYKPASAAIKTDITERIYTEVRRASPTIVTENDKVGSIGKNYSILAGMKLVLKCPVAGDPKPDIIWLKNGELIAENVDSLVFNHASDIDDGEYVCKATNVFGTQEVSSKIVVMERKKPVIQRDPAKNTKTEVISSVSGKGSVVVDIGDDLKTLIGTEVSVRCPAIGVPSPTVSFFKDGIQISTDDNFIVDSENRILTIRKAKKGLQGDYVCVAKNSAGSYNLSSNVQLINPVAPSIAEKKTNPTYKYDVVEGKGYLFGTIGANEISAYPGTSVYIDCPVAGFPTPDISWLRNGKPITEDNQFARVEKNGTLVLPHLTRGIQGTYECFAVNVAGGYARNLTVSVTDPASPMILKKTGLADLSQTLKGNVTIGENVIALLDAEIIINCPFKAEPEASVMWSGEKGFELQQRNVIELNGGRQLKIQKVTKMSNGFYKCIASNIFGSDFAVTRITVVESLKPVITSVKENVTSYMGSNELSLVIGGRLDAPNGIKVTITCPVSGTPNPNVKWLFNDQELAEKAIISATGVATYTLDKLKLKNSGKYTCLAENVLGSAKASTYIYVGLVPNIQSMSNKNSIISAINKDSVTIPIGGKVILSTSSEFVLQCLSIGRPAPSVTWYKDGIRLESGSKYLSVIRGLMNIPSVVAKDDGVYTCIARNKFGVRKASTTLIVVDPPRIIDDPSNTTKIDPLSKVIHASIGGSLTVLRGVKLVISCPVRGIPQPNIRWRRVDAFFNIDPRISLTSDSDLQIEKVEPKDTGIYVCMASNKAGNDEKTLKLTVAEPPFAKVSSSHLNSLHRANAPAVGVTQRLIVPVNQNVTITCSVQGSPLPRIQWFKNGVDIHIDGRKYFAQGDELSIQKVGKEDAGNYHCVAENLAGKNMATVELIVGEKPKIHRSEEKVIRILPSTVKAKMGQYVGVRRHSVVMIVCEVTGNPKPKVMWNKNGQEIDLNLLAEGSRVLLLKDMSFRDAGNYTCMAQNEIGQDRVTTEIVVVEPASIVKPKKEGFKKLGSTLSINLGEKKDINLHALEGEELKVMCVFEGFPLPEVIWQKNLHDIAYPSASTYWSTKHRFISTEDKLVGRVESVLTLKKLELFEFEISCKGMNNAGKLSARLKLHVHEAPKLPYKGVWISSASEKCEGECIGALKALQIVKITCLSYGNKALSFDQCDPSTRPDEKRFCRTKRCDTSWGIGPWGKCSSDCGTDGFHKRAVKCMYKNGAEVAKDKECRHILPRKPKAYEECNRIPCVKDKCVDNQSYCAMVKSLGYCKTEWSRQECCESCGHNLQVRI